MSAGVDAEELDVDHVADPRQRMPVEVEGPERPRDAVRGEPFLHLIVVRDVDRVVVAEELVVAELEEDDEGDDDEPDADEQVERRRRGGASP
jgi:hypothetical protein